MDTTTQTWKNFRIFDTYPRSDIYYYISGQCCQLLHFDVHLHELELYREAKDPNPRLRASLLHELEGCVPNNAMPKPYNTYCGLLVIRLFIIQFYRQSTRTRKIGHHIEQYSIGSRQTRNYWASCGRFYYGIC